MVIHGAGTIRKDHKAMHRNRLVAREMTAEDVDHIVANFRREDRAEIAAAGRTPAEVRQEFKDAIANPDMVTRVFSEIGGPAVLAFAFHDNGYVWALGTNAIEQHAREVARRTRSVFEVIARRREVRGMDRRTWTNAFRFNYTHLRWLTWAGFRPVEGRVEPDMGPDFQLMMRD